jgi:hypothetical protein
LAAALGALLLVIAIAVAPTLIRNYAVEFRGPELQQCLGFTASEVSVLATGSEEMRVFLITSLREDSPLARAGLRPADIPVGYEHGFAVGFYDDLQAALNGEDVSLSVLATADWSKGTAGWRTIRLGRLPVKCK